VRNAALCRVVNIVACVAGAFRVAALHQFILQRLPVGIYGSDDDIDPASRGFRIMSRDDLRAVIDVGYAEVCVRLSDLVSYLVLPYRRAEDLAD